MIECACCMAASACWKQSRNKRVNANHSCQRIFVVPVMHFFRDAAGGCFTNVSRAPQIFSWKYTTPEITFMVKICTCAQSKALGTRTRFQLEILITSIIYAIHKFREEFLESSRNVSETTPRCISGAGAEGRGRSWLCWFTKCFLIDNSCNVCMTVADRLFDSSAEYWRKIYIISQLFYDNCIWHRLLCKCVMINLIIPHPVASEHRWLVKAPRWIHSVPDVSGRRSLLLLYCMCPDSWVAHFWGRRLCSLAIFLLLYILLGRHVF